MAKFNDLTLPLDNDDPLAYNSDSRVFSVSSNDISLIDNQSPLRTYSVEVEFTNYPSSDHDSVSTALATSTIEFINPCLKPFTFERTVQD